MTILIAGYGYLGQKLGEILISTGHEVVGARRSVPQDRSVPENRSAPQEQGLVKEVQADFSHPILSTLPEHVDQIVYAVSADERSEDAYQIAYPLGVKNLKQRYPGARFLFVSSTSVYDQSEGQRVDEQSEAKASGFAPEALRKAEEIALAQGGKRRAHVVMRASGIYGPGRSRFVTSLRDRSLDPAEGSLYTNRIHRDDLARAISFVLGRSEEGGVFIASDECPATLQEIQLFLHEALPPKSVPPGGQGSRADAQSPTRTRKSRRLYPARLRSLGFQFTYPGFREGYRTLLE